MEMPETVVTGFIEVGKCLATPIWRQYKYLHNYKSNFDKLLVEVCMLKDARYEVQDKVADAENNAQTIRETVQRWLGKANSLISEAESLIDEKSNNRCFMGLCPNLITRYKHSREALKKSKSIGGLLEEEKEFDEVCLSIQEMRLASIDQDYDPFKSRESTLEDILKALNDDNVSMIGIYGMSGVGKTTLAKAIGRQVKEKNLFDEVVFVEVTDTPDITKIQTELGDKLRLTFNNETEKASKFYERLKEETKTLVILNNLWADLDLKEIGIPYGVDRGGCKLLLTSRDRHLLVRMGAEPFQLGNLSEEDAWSLFKKINSGDFLEVGELTSLAREVCMKCGGLPIAIVAVAKALKNKTCLPKWREAIRQLERPSPRNFNGDLRFPYLSIELSYNFLEGEELKRTFLLCSLMGHEASILDLAKYVMGLNIFQEIHKMQDTRDKIYSLIQKLKDKCLLLNGDTEESFSMHDFIRKVAISIAMRDDHVFSVRNQNEWEWPGKNTQETCTKIFIRDSKISEIPETLECPKLVSFVLHNRDIDFDVKIPDTFFFKTTKLKVLDLTRMPVFSLRSLSLHLLKDLQTLCLDGCEFGDVAVIGALKELKILSLRDSYVEQLPTEIGQLTKLRFLDLSNSLLLEVINSDVISRLHKLEELHMSNCPKLRWGKNFEELKHLSDLITLEVDIKDDIMMLRALFSKELQRYKILIGDDSKFYNFLDKPADFHEPETSRRLIFMKTSFDVWSKLELKCFKNVESLYISESQDIENVLYVLNLLDLIWDSQLHSSMSSSCQNLVQLTIIDCNKLKYLFPSSNVANNLKQLQHLEIRNCKVLEEVIAKGTEEEIVTFEFPKVTNLILKDLPEFAFFYPGEHTIKWPMLKYLRVENCVKLQIFTPKYKVDFSSLEVLSLYEQDIDQEKWDNQLMSFSCQNLVNLTISGCNKLKYLFPSSNMVENLKHLQSLEISNCKVLEVVVAKGREETVATFKFPKVTNLTLQNLPEFAFFYPGEHTTKWPMLKYLRVENCVKLQIFTTKYKIYIPNLEELIIAVEEHDDDDDTIAGPDSRKPLLLS